MPASSGGLAGSSPNGDSGSSLRLTGPAAPSPTLTSNVRRILKAVALVLALFTPTFVLYEAGDGQVWTLTAPGALWSLVLGGFMFGGFGGASLALVVAGTLIKYAVFWKLLALESPAWMRWIGVGLVVAALYGYSFFATGTQTMIATRSLTPEVSREELVNHFGIWRVAYQLSHREPVESEVSSLNHICLADCFYWQYHDGPFIGKKMSPDEGKACFHDGKLVYWYGLNSNVSPYQAVRDIESGKATIYQNSSTGRVSDYLSSLPRCNGDYANDCVEPKHLGMCGTGLYNRDASEEMEAQSYYRDQGLSLEPQVRLDMALADGEDQLINFRSTFFPKDAILYIRPDGKITNGVESFGWLIREDDGESVLAPNYHFSRVAELSGGKAGEQYAIKLGDYKNAGGKNLFDIYGFSAEQYRFLMVQAAKLAFPPPATFLSCPGTASSLFWYKVPGGYRPDDAPNKLRPLQLIDNAGMYSEGEIMPDKSIVWTSSAEYRVRNSRSLPSDTYFRCRTADAGVTINELHNQYLHLVASVLAPIR